MNNTCSDPTVPYCVPSQQVTNPFTHGTTYVPTGHSGIAPAAYDPGTLAHTGSFIDPTFVWGVVAAVVLGMVLLGINLLMKRRERSRA